METANRLLSDPSSESRKVRPINITGCPINVTGVLLQNSLPRHSRAVEKGFLRFGLLDAGVVNSTGTIAQHSGDASEQLACIQCEHDNSNARHWTLQFTINEDSHRSNNEHMQRAPSEISGRNTLQNATELKSGTGVRRISA